MSTRSLRYNTLNRHVPKSRLASTDRDALAFLEAATIYNENQQRAIIELVRRLKAAGLWSKMKAIYPFVGGTATTHKFNLKDPQDTDAAFRLTFTGGWTHASTGAKPNGTTAYANTFLDASIHLTHLSWGLSYYSRTNNTSEISSEIRSFSGPPNRSLMLRAAASYLGCDFPDITFTTTNDSRGLWIGTTRASNDRELYRNGVSERTVTTTYTTTAPALSLYLAASNQLSSGVPNIALYSSKECAFATIGDGLTDSDASNLYSIVDLFQRRLGRNV